MTFDPGLDVALLQLGDAQGAAILAQFVQNPSGVFMMGPLLIDR